MHKGQVINWHVPVCLCKSVTYRHLSRTGFNRKIYFHLQSYISGRCDNWGPCTVIDILSLLAQL